ncbi:MAG: isocitrate dehydrogenase (NADP(+)) [Candidatus Omnitrophica bacterium]|nr:isocitrate dehydrogenase (NADP(+)) [Candidatus Omnitrophota bacterium]
MKFKKIKVPAKGQKIEIKDNKLSVPFKPIIPFIEGDGIGSDITKAALKVWNAAVESVYGNKRKIYWLEIYAGQKALKLHKEILPLDTLNAIKNFIVAIKGPLITPVGGGWRSLNVTLRQTLDLYACVRPIYYFEGVPSPVKRPQDIDIVIFRENTEDVYAGIEWPAKSLEAQKVIKFLKRNFNIAIQKDAGIGIKPISEMATKRLVRKAIIYAIENKRKSVTLVHKGNIMKFTEGAFRDWGYEVAKSEFAEYVLTEEEYLNQNKAENSSQKIIIKDRIADSMFQQILTRPSEYDVIALPNLNGDYFSDACAAQIGGLGMAPGANIGDFIALFEPTHGAAPKYANSDMANPTALILSGAMMFEYLGWKEVSMQIKNAIQKTIKQKKVTYDLARLMKNIKPIKTSEFAYEIIKNLK